MRGPAIAADAEAFYRAVVLVWDGKEEVGGGGFSH